MTESYRPEPEQVVQPQYSEPPAYPTQQPYTAPPQYGNQQYGYGQQPQSYPPQPSYGQQYVNRRKDQAEKDKSIAMTLAILSMIVAPIPCGPLAWWFANKSISNGGDAQVWKIIGIVETFLPIAFILFFIMFAGWATSVNLH